VRRTLDQETVRAAFQVTINGKPYCESEDITAMTMVVEELRRGGSSRISLHVAAGQAPLQGLAANFAIGDEILIRIIDADDIELTGPAGCSFCGREAQDVSSLVHGPSAAICDGCVTGMGGALGNGSPLPLGASIREEPEWACGFCANKPGTIPGVVVRNGAAVCSECLRTCVDILADRPGR